MMNREEKVRASIQKAIEAGYEFLGKGVGSQDEALESFRSQGYDVKGWYTTYQRDNMMWIMYGKKKGQRKSKKSETQHAMFTTDSFTGKTYYHGFSESVDYSTMTVKELRKICSDKKIAGYSKMNKQQIVDVLAAC